MPKPPTPHHAQPSSSTSPSPLYTQISYSSSPHHSHLIIPTASTTLLHISQKCYHPQVPYSTQSCDIDALGRTPIIDTREKIMYAVKAIVDTMKLVTIIETYT